MNKPMIKYYGKFVFDHQSQTKTPKYYLSNGAGWFPELENLRGQNGKVNLYLMPKRENQSIDAPSMSLAVVKNGLNLTGLKEFYVNGSPSGYAYGYPLPTEKYRNKPNPFYTCKEDGFLFKFEMGDNTTQPLSFEMIVIDGGRVLITSYCKMLQIGVLDEELKELQKQASTI